MVSISTSLLPLLLSCCLAGLSLADSTDDLLRLELEEAASDSRLLAEELAGMLARLDTENTRQEAVEAAVVGDEIKVEAALQEMLSKLEGLEEVASEDSRSVELKGSLEEKIKKEEELRETLETLETVASEIKDVSSDKDIQTIDEMTKLLDSINDKIEAKAGSPLKNSEELQTALHLNGIDEMIRSLEKVTVDLREMQDDLDDYFEEDTDAAENNTPDTENDTAEETADSSPKTLTELLISRNSSKTSEDSESESEPEQRSRKPKQLVDDVEYADSEAGSGAGYSEGEDCTDVEAENRVKICLPKFRSLTEEVKLYTGKISNVRHCYDVTKTVCSQSSQIVSKEVCVYGYSQNIVVAHLQLAEITFEKRLKKFAVSKCKKAIVKEGYQEKDIEACEEEYVEIPYRLPSIVGTLDDFLELNLPEPEVKCQLYKYDIPEVMCEEETRNHCSDLAKIEPASSSEYIETQQPHYQGNCKPETLNISQKECKVEAKKPYSTFY